MLLWWLLNKNIAFAENNLFKPIHEKYLSKLIQSRTTYILVFEIKFARKETFL